MALPESEYDRVIKSVRPVHLIVLFPGIDHGYAASLVRGKNKISPYLQRLVVRELKEAKESGLLDQIDEERPPRASFVRGEGGVRARRRARAEARHKAACA